MQVLHVPLVRQSQEYSCGAAALASVLYYWGVWEGREPELFSLLDTDELGTHGEDIVNVARSFGLTATYESSMTISRLQELLADGCTCILDIQAWIDRKDINWEEEWEDGHYVVLIGINNDIAYFMDPSLAGRYGMMTTKDLDSRWHDWNDEGDAKEYHSAIIIKGAVAGDMMKPVMIL